MLEVSGLFTCMTFVFPLQISLLPDCDESSGHLGLLASLVVFAPACLLLSITCLYLRLTYATSRAKAIDKMTDATVRATMVPGGVLVAVVPEYDGVLADVEGEPGLADGAGKKGSKTLWRRTCAIGTEGMRRKCCLLANLECGVV